MDLKLSFILPVYNVEAFLPRCLDSILGQMDDSCEIITVDDGTPDSSGRICDEYAARDSRVKVLHKKNGGPSSARNAGVRMAEGEYICFVDSDDFIEENTVPKLLNWIQDTHLDLCFLQAAKVYSDGSRESVREDIRSQFVRGKDRTQVLRYLASRNTFSGGPWGKLYRREFLLKNNITFPEGRISEDLVFCLAVYLRAEGIDCLDFPFYCYCQQRADSLTSVITPSYYNDTFLFIEEVVRDYGQTGRPENVDGELALSAAAFEYAVLVWQTLALPEAYRDAAWEKLKKYRWVLKFGQSSKAKMIRTAAAVLGLKNAARLADFYQKHRS